MMALRMKTPFSNCLIGLAAIWSTVLRWFSSSHPFLDGWQKKGWKTYGPWKRTLFDEVMIWTLHLTLRRTYIKCKLYASSECYLSLILNIVISVNVSDCSWFLGFFALKGDLLAVVSPFDLCQLLGDSFVRSQSLRRPWYDLYGQLDLLQGPLRFTDWCTRVMNLVWLLYIVWVSYTKVSQTTGLFSSPGAVVLQGEGVDVLEDVDMVRQAGTFHWPGVALHLHVVEMTSFRGRKDSLCQKHRPTKRLLKLYGQNQTEAQLACSFGVHEAIMKS